MNSDTLIEAIDEHQERRKGRTPELDKLIEEYKKCVNNRDAAEQDVLNALSAVIRCHSEVSNGTTDTIV